MARQYASQAVMDTGFELQVIAAVVLGGTSLFGGRGVVLGTVLGALIIGHEGDRGSSANQIPMPMNAPSEAPPPTPTSTE